MLLVLCWPRPARDDGDGADLRQQELALRADLQRLQAQVAGLAAAFTAPPRAASGTAAAQLRYELANAKAMAVLAGLPPPPKEKR